MAALPAPAAQPLTHTVRAGCRVLLSRPRLVLMDEATSALDVANEEHLYAALREAGVTFVSIGHRPTLLAFHEKILRLVPGTGGAPSSWEVMEGEVARA